MKDLLKKALTDKNARKAEVLSVVALATVVGMPWQP